MLTNRLLQQGGGVGGGSALSPAAGAFTPGAYSPAPTYSPASGRTTPDAFHFHTPLSQPSQGAPARPLPRCAAAR